MTNVAPRYELDYVDETVTLRCLLPSGADVTEIWRASRHALVEFVEESAAWGKRELAAWLVGSYRDATKFSEDDLVDADAPPPSSRSSSVGDEPLRRVIRAAQAEARAALERGDDAMCALVVRAHAQRWVLPIRDAKGKVGYMARTLGTMTLAERVLALVVVDHLCAAKVTDSFVDPPVSGTRPRL